MNITTVGIDLAKNVFQLHGVDDQGRNIVQKKIARHKLPEFMANLPPCLIGLEACGGAHYWARKFSQIGHQVKLMSPQFVKPYVKSNKNDALDAQAICEAVTRPTMRFVAPKSIEQQDIQSLHRIRSNFVKQRTALTNQIRGLLAEYGIIIAQGITHVRKKLPEIVEDANNDLSFYGRQLFNELLNTLQDLDKKVDHYNQQVETVCKNNEICQRLVKIEGVGALTATALVASIGDAQVFKNGREMSAFIGLVPKQHSSGGKTKLLGISKRGDRYLRCLLIHGARAVISRSKNLPKKKAQWLADLIERRGKNRAIVALANKNVRMMWAMMAHDEQYCAAK
ncbi:MAG TPA: IS110 family transposase [Cyclobacteriaceae bacterium]|nr:IS110 family transposase [Cyclobacteriaceae bacterium]